MLIAYATIAAFAIVAAGFIIAALWVGKYVRPRSTGVAVGETYECGEAPIAQAWFNFNPRFYIIALIFIVFDVEIAFLYPVALVLRRWVEAGWGVFAAVEIALFVAILLVGLAYVWRKGDLEWIRSLRRVDDAPFIEPVRAGATGAKTVDPVAEEAA